ncbi:MAG: carboxypeptidase regulatory-like domain-containing protein [Bacteroidaceae bacterium]|nr:carboxypeptidase regulatory-like domain-containing protein [Bacteroidaceae bacterium]
MKQKRTTACRVWMSIAIMLATALGVRAQGNITLKLLDEPLPKALQLIEQQGGKSIIFSVSETEKHRVSTDLSGITQAEAIDHILWGKPFVAKERPECFVIQRKKDRDASLGIAGMVMDVKGEPIPNCNVQVFTTDSVYVNGATTDKEGCFSIPLKRDEEYRMQVSYIGYKTAYRQCQVGHVGTIVMNHDAMRLSEVKVTGMRAESRNEEQADTLRTVAVSRRKQAAEVIPSVNIIGVSNNRKSLALGALGNVVREKAYGLQIAGLSNHVGDMGGGVAIAGLSNTSGGSYYGIQVSGLGNISRGMMGIQVAGLGNITRDTRAIQVAGLTNISKELYGIQISGLTNISQDAYGLQLAGLTNISKDVYGLQVGGLTNIAQDTYGLQLAGLFNVSHDLYGMQLAGLFNCAKDVYGLQFAGLMNVAKRARGVQFAAILNVAEESDFPIGLINIIKQGDKGVALTYDMLGNAVMSFRSGGKYTYGIFGVGCNAQIEERLVVEAGYGLQVPVCRWLDVNNEFKATTMGYNSGYTRSNFSYLLAPSLTLWRHCNLFAGASINYFMSDRASAATLLSNAGLWRKEGDRGIGQLYLGYQVGVQYVF